MRSRIEASFLVLEADDEDPQILLPRLPEPVHAVLGLELFFSSDIDRSIDDIVSEYRPKEGEAKQKRLPARLFNILRK